MPGNRRHGTAAAAAAAARVGSALYLRPSQSNFCFSDNDDDEGAGGTTLQISLLSDARNKNHSVLGRRQTLQLLLLLMSRKIDLKVQQ